MIAATMLSIFDFTDEAALKERIEKQCNFDEEAEAQILYDLICVNINEEHKINNNEESNNNNNNNP